MNAAILALVLPPMLIVPAMGVLSRIEADSPLLTEVRRKLFHMAVGFGALAFPYLLTRTWMVVGSLGIVLAWLVAAKRIPAIRERFGAVLHGAGRQSAGELYFAAAIATLLLATAPGSVLYTLPVLILTVSDTVAAIAGRLFPVGQYGRHAKTASGSAAFMVSAFALAYVSLRIGGQVPTLDALLLALAIAVSTTAAEAFSTRGADNLTVPVSAWLVLHYLAPGV